MTSMINEYDDCVISVSDPSWEIYTSEYFKKIFDEYIKQSTYMSNIATMSLTKIYAK